MNIKRLSILAILIIISGGILFMKFSYDKEDDRVGNEVSNEMKEDNNIDEFVSQVNVLINGVSFTATLEDNEASRMLLRKMPLTITMNELNGNEKYYYFNDSFPINPVKVEQINSGDIMLFGTDCLVVFYESFTTPYGYTRIGKIDDVANLKSTLGNGAINVTISK